MTRQMRQSIQEWTKENLWNTVFKSCIAYILLGTFSNIICLKSNFTRELIATAAVHCFLLSLKRFNIRDDRLIQISQFVKNVLSPCQVSYAAFCL